MWLGLGSGLGLGLGLALALPKPPQVIMWWGGLRGSVGLALALVIQHTIYDQKMWGEEDGGSHMIRNWDGDKVNSLDCRPTLTLP